MTLLEIVKKLEDRTDRVRRDMICDYLNSMNVDFEKHSYGKGKKGGYKKRPYDTKVNIIVPSDKTSEIGISNHFDVVYGSPGANDNCSAIAVTLGLIKRFQETPTKNVGIRYFFFDEEETGLRGSKAYVRDYGTNELFGLYNLELVGFGNQIALWETRKNQNTPLFLAFEKQAELNKIKTHKFSGIVTSSADHLSFREAGIEAFTITAITEQDALLADDFIKLLSKNAPVEEISPFMERIEELNFIIKKTPIFSHHHQPTDKSCYLNEETLQMVSNLLYGSICDLDKRITSSARFSKP